MSEPGICELPKTPGGALPNIGPSLILTANIVASGELIMTTALGARPARREEEAMPEHRRRRATPSGGGKPLEPFGLRAAHTRLLCCGSSMMLGHHPPRRASYPDPRRL